MDQKTKKEKVANIEAQFHDLASSRTYQCARGRGTTAKVAISRAFANLLKQPAVTRKHIHTIKATITIATVEVECDQSSASAVSA